MGRLPRCGGEGGHDTQETRLGPEPTWCAGLPIDRLCSGLGWTNRRGVRVRVVTSVAYCTFDKWLRVTVYKTNITNPTPTVSLSLSIRSNQSLGSIIVVSLSRAQIVCANHFLEHLVSGSSVTDVFSNKW